MIHTVKLASGLALAALLACARSDGQLLIWEVSGVAGDTNQLTAQTIAANLTLGSSFNTLTRTGVNGSSSAASFNSTAWNTSNTFVEADDYVSFMLQPLSGCQVSVTALVYRVTGSSTAPATGRWGYKVGSGSFVFQPDFTIGTSTTPAAWDLDDFTTTDTVEFRFWAYGATSVGGGTSGSTGAIRTPVNGAGDDLILLGEVIPEPSTILLMGVAMVGLLAVRRRHS